MQISSTHSLSPLFFAHPHLDCIFTFRSHFIYNFEFNWNGHGPNWKLNHVNSVLFIGSVIVSTSLFTGQDASVVMYQSQLSVHHFRKTIINFTATDFDCFSSEMQIHKLTNVIMYNYMLHCDACMYVEM